MFFEEIAIQLKSFSFILGLGAFFSITRSNLYARIGLPKIKADSNRPSVKIEADKLLNIHSWGSRGMILLFIIALVLYTASINKIDTKALQTEDITLSCRQVYAVVSILVVSAIFILLDVGLNIARQKYKDLYNDTK